jgi:hypothetical protein
VGLLEGGVGDKLRGDLRNWEGGGEGQGEGDASGGVGAGGMVDTIAGSTGSAVGIE